MGEYEEAVALANRVLDRPPGADPDDDLAILARQFLRAVEREQNMRSGDDALVEVWRREIVAAVRAALAEALEAAVLREREKIWGAAALWLELRAVELRGSPGAPAPEALEQAAAAFRATADGSRPPRARKEMTVSKASTARRRAARRVTNAIVEELFVNGAGECADRLVLTSTDGRDLGGLCKRAVVDTIERLVLAALAGFTATDNRLPPAPAAPPAPGGAPSP